MATDITIKSLFPAIRNTELAQTPIDVFNTTFIGIDFGTSTTAVSIATLTKDTKEIKTESLWLNQKMYDGAIMSAEKIPTVIAWYNNQLLVGLTKHVDKLQSNQFWKDLNKILEVCSC